MNTELKIDTKTKTFLYRNNIQVYISDLPRLRYSDDDGSNDEKNMEQSAKWLVENDSECEFKDVEEYIKFIKGAKVFYKIMNNASEEAYNEILEEEDSNEMLSCDCGRNLGREDELIKKIEERTLDKLFPPL